MSLYFVNDHIGGLGVDLDFSALSYGEDLEKGHIIYPLDSRLRGNDTLGGRAPIFEITNKLSL